MRAQPRRRRGTGALAVPAAGAAALLLAAGCELREVVVTAPENVLVAEVYLLVGHARQFAFLHGTLAQQAEPPEAAIEVRGPAGAVVYRPVPWFDCLVTRTLDDGEQAPLPSGHCYAADVPEDAIVPGQSYTLEVRARDGRVLRGVTQVPGDFEVTAPAEPVCELPPWTALPIAWTPARGAWAYVVEASVFGLREVLAEQGIEVPQEPLRLRGVSIAERDTTILFPTHLGLFERGTLDLELLLALARGLPPGVNARVVVAAADRNTVNWVRGGAFNPSGRVRTPSVFGDGTGVFGSAVLRSFGVDVRGQELWPSCA
jgi:hypothetical protein